MYSDMAYQAAFSAMVEIVEDSALADPEFTFGRLTEGRRREITQAFIEHLNDHDWADLVIDATEDREWAVRDFLGAIADQVHDELNRELTARADIRRGFREENQRANQADLENDMRRVS